MKDSTSTDCRSGHARSLSATLLIFVAAFLVVSGVNASETKEIFHAGYELGAVIDVRQGRTEGARVLAITPGGAGDRMGLRVGDRVRSINGHSLADPQTPSQQLSRALRESQGSVRLHVVRDGKPLQLAGTIDTLPLSQGAGCGFVTTLGTVPYVTQDIHLAGITMIDGRSTPFYSTNRYQLDAGLHVLVVAENIEPHRLSNAQNRQIRRMMQRNHVRGFYKALVIDIKPNIAYYVGAKVNRSKLDRDSIQANEHWEPVVWQERPIACR